MASLNEAIAPLIQGPVFGTMNSKNIYQSVSNALTNSYRNFDLAERYESQDEVGRAICDSSIPREECFIINKIDGIPNGSYDDIKYRVIQMLSTTKLEYFDLLLIHYPLKTSSDLNEVPSTLINGSDSWLFYCNNILEAWKNMTQLVKDKLVRHIGVSNFYQSHIEFLLNLIQQNNSEEFAPLEVSQNFIDVFHPEYDLVEFCTKNNIQCLSYRSLAFLQVYAFIENLIDNLEMKSKSCDYDHISEFILGWLSSRGIVTICSSTNSDHMISNFNAASTLKDADLLSLKPSSSSSSSNERVDSNELIDILTNNVEMVDMYGGVDEYAMAFKSMFELADTQPSSSSTSSSEMVAPEDLAVTDKIE